MTDMEAKKKNPDPADEARIYGGFDDAPREMDKEPAYYDAVLPEHIKKALAERKQRTAA